MEKTSEKKEKVYIFRHREKKNGKKAFFGVRWCDEFRCFDMLKELNRLYAMAVAIAYTYI